MQEITLQPGESITVTAALSDVPTEPEPEPDPETGFHYQTLTDLNKWRAISSKNVAIGGEIMSLGAETDPDTRQLKFKFRFINPKTGASRYIDAPTPVWYSPAGLCQMFISDGRLILWGSVSNGLGVKAYEFLLVGEPVTEIVFERDTYFGDTESRAMAATMTDSGGIVVSWYQHKALRNTNIVIGVAYLNRRTWEWSDHLIEMQDGTGGTITSCNGYAVAQHPISKKIWVFYKRDSYHLVSALLFKETFTGLHLEKQMPHFISKRTVKYVDEHLPEGENPSMEIVSLPDRGTLMLACQADKWEIFKVEYHPEHGYLTAFVKGAWILFTEIDAEGNFLGRQFHLPEWHERLARFGLLYHNNKLWVTHLRLDESTPDVWRTPAPVYGSCYDFATDRWEPPVEIALLDTWPLNLVNQQHVEAAGLNAITFQTPDDVTTLVTIE